MCTTKTCGIVWILLDKLDMKSSGEQLAALISATLLKFHTGIKFRQTSQIVLVDSRLQSS